MALILDFNRYKSAGIYVEEYDNTTMSNDSAPDSLRLLVGFANKGIFNRPVFLQNDNDREKMFGEINTKLEHKGCFFNRMAKTMLSSSPILALNLLKVDDSISGPDQVNYAAMSLDAGAPNPVVLSSGSAYGEYDYLAGSVDADVYDTAEGDYVPYIGKTPYSSLFDRSRFWVPSENNLLSRAANDLNTGDVTSFEKTNFLNFANISTDEISILVYKPETLAGYSITAAEWYNGTENIPFGWIRPSDYMSEYFLTVIAVKGNWTNYSNLATDNIWGAYFDNKGILKDSINKFIGAEGVEMIGSWTGSIIPDFTDKQGNNQCLFNKINAATDRTGLMMAFNEDAAEVLAYDYNGVNEEGEEAGIGCWFFDIDGDRQMQSSQGESAADVYLIDMIGHNFQKGFKNDESSDEGTREYSAAFLNPDAIKGLAGCETYWLKSFNQLSENNDIVASGTFTAKDSVEYSDTKDVSAWTDRLSKKFKYTFDYSSTERKVYLMVDKAIADGIDASVSVIEYYVSRENQADSTAAVDIPVFDSTDSANYPASVEIAENVFGNDTISLKLNVKLAREPKDGENAQWSDGVEVSITYTSPSDTLISTQFGGYYGNYLVLKTDGQGAVLDADIYALTRKPVTVSRVTKYVDTFQLVVSNINVEYINKEYVLTYPMTSKKVTYYIEPKIALTDDIAADAGLFGSLSPVLVDELNNGTVLFYSNINAILDIADDDPHRLYGVNFLSYNYVTKSKSDVVSAISSVHYFKDACGEDNVPVSKDNLNTFIVTDDAMSKKISVGDFVNNITFNNADGEAQHYKLIPGLTRIINKIFVQVSASNTFTYKGVTYDYAFPNEMIINKDFGTQGFYLFTAIDPVLIENGTVERSYAYGHIYDNSTGEELSVVKCYPIVLEETESSFIESEDAELVIGVGRLKWEDENGVDLSADMFASVGKFVEPVEGTDYSRVVVRMGDGDYEVIVVSNTPTIYRQLPLSSDVISKSLRWIPMKGLKLSSRHKPGYDANGNIDIEGGIKKIYSVLEDAGIRRGLTNSEMVDYRYVVDSFGYGLDSELGGKVYLSKLAKDRGKCTALLNLPSQRQFAASENPYFCDTYVNGAEVKPALNTKYIPEGGNAELYATKQFSLPSEENGSKFAAAFWPYVQYSSTNGKKLLVPPAGDISNIFMRKFQGGDPYCICANMNGIFGNNVVDVEYLVDQVDRDYLEPMGVNTIIRQNGAIMIYGNQTCYQALKSDFNKLHIRENLNTLEIECEAALKRFNFLYNTAVTRAAIVTAITPICQAMQNAGALYRYKIVCDETNNTSEVIQNSFGVVDIEVEMAKGMEKIIQRITLQKAGTLEA